MLYFRAMAVDSSISSIVVMFHHYWCIWKPWSYFIMLYNNNKNILAHNHHTHNVMFSVFLHLYIQVHIHHGVGERRVYGGTAPVSSGRGAGFPPLPGSVLPAHRLLPAAPPAPRQVRDYQRNDMFRLLLLYTVVVIFQI